MRVGAKIMKQSKQVLKSTAANYQEGRARLFLGFNTQN